SWCQATWRCWPSYGRVIACGSGPLEHGSAPPRGSPLARPASARRAEDLGPEGAGHSHAQLPVIGVHDVRAVAWAREPSGDDLVHLVVAPRDVLRQPGPGVALAFDALHQRAAVGADVAERGRSPHVLAV